VLQYIVLEGSKAVGPSRAVNSRSWCTVNESHLFGFGLAVGSVLECILEHRLNACATELSMGIGTRLRHLHVGGVEITVIIVHAGQLETLKLGGVSKSAAPIRAVRSDAPSGGARGG
jgi:hypothetical protein